MDQHLLPSVAINVGPLMLGEFFQVFFQIYFMKKFHLIFCLMSTKDFIQEKKSELGSSSHLGRQDQDRAQVKPNLG